MILKSTLQILFLLFSSFLFSDEIQDEFWSSIKIGKSINNFNIDICHEVRYEDDYTELQKSLTDLSVSYKLSKKVKFYSQYRYIVYNDKFKSRYSLSNKISHDYKDFDFGLKTKIQKDFINNKIPEDLIIRNKFSINYDYLPFFNTYVSYEFFHEYLKNKIEFEKYRISLGIKYDISKIIALKLFYTYNGEFDNSEFEVKNIIGMNYEISF